MELLYSLKEIRLSRRKKQAILATSVAFAVGYGGYRLYTHPSIARKRRRLLSLSRALITIAESASSVAEALSIVSDDISIFLRSDSDRLPNSLTQISKIATSGEFSESLAKITESITIGLARGLKNLEPEEGVAEVSSSFPTSMIDRVLDRLFSVAGTGFASVVVGSFARSLVLAFYTDERRSSGGRESDGAQMGVPVPDWVNVLCGSKLREIIAGFIQVFVSTAVAVYLDKTMDINTYDDIFSGLTNPKHEAKVKEMLVSLCNGAIESLVKTSHRVLSVNPVTKPTTSSLISDRLSAIHGVGITGNGELGLCNGVRGKPDETQKDCGWIDKVSCTLAAPNNRRFLLDVTGRVTSETVKSFLDFSMLKLGSGLRRGVNAVGCDQFESVKELLRYAGAKSIVISTFSLALCLHVLVGMKTLTPA